MWSRCKALCDQYSIRLVSYLTWALLLFTSIRCLITKHEIFTHASFQSCKWPKLMKTFTCFCTQTWNWEGILETKLISILILKIIHLTLNSCMIKSHLSILLFSKHSKPINRCFMANIDTLVASKIASLKSCSSVMIRDIRNKDAYH